VAELRRLLMLLILKWGVPCGFKFTPIVYLAFAPPLPYTFYWSRAGFVLIL
jgi:hypothetical protein